MYKKQDEGHKRENGDLTQARWTVFVGRAQGGLMCTVLLPQLKGVMACKLAERCSISWYQGKGTSYPSHPDSMRSNGQPSSQPLVQALLCTVYSLQLSQFPVREKGSLGMAEH